MSEKIPYEQVMGRMRMDIDYIAEEAYQKGKHDAEQDLARAAYEEAYQKGFEAGQHEATTLEYQQGLDDAWEMAKRIVLTKTDTKCPYFSAVELKIFGCFTYQGVFDTYSASEAIEKVKAHEQQKAGAEIKVGDEVCFVFAGGETIEPFIVFSIKDDNGKKYYEGIQTSDGRWVNGGLKYYKTGRHFPQVAELLKAMKEGAE